MAGDESVVTNEQFTDKVEHRERIGSIGSPRKPSPERRSLSEKSGTYVSATTTHRKSTKSPVSLRPKKDHQSTSKKSSTKYSGVSSPTTGIPKSLQHLHYPSRPKTSRSTRSSGSSSISGRGSIIKVPSSPFQSRSSLSSASSFSSKTKSDSIVVSSMSTQTSDSTIGGVKISLNKGKWLWI